MTTRPGVAWSLSGTAIPTRNRFDCYEGSGNSFDPCTPLTIQVGERTQSRHYSSHEGGNVFLISPPTGSSSVGLAHSFSAEAVCLRSRCCNPPNKITLLELANIDCMKRNIPGYAFRLINRNLVVFFKL